jgi:hypothetical protein
MRTKTAVRDKRITRKVTHLLWYRKHYGVTEPRLERMLRNKGSRPPVGAYCYMIHNKAGAPRYQELIVDIVKMRLTSRNQRIDKENTTT